MINFFSDDVRRNPFPLYDEIRAASPVLHDPQSDMWMIFDYEGARRALSDPDQFSSSISTVAGHPTPQWLVFFDPPRHSKLRALVSRAFTPRVIAGLEPRIAELSRRLLDQNIGRGEMDLATDYSVPLPTMVIAQLIGIPIDDWPRFKRWSDAMAGLSNTIRGMHTEQTPEAVSEFYAAVAEIKEYLPGLVAQRRAQPREDLLTGLALAEVDGQRLTQEDLEGFFQLLLVGGQETTTSLINNAILCLRENPEQLARLRERMELLPSAIEEVLRYRSPFQWIFRAMRREVEMHGQVIPAGKIVLVMIGSANRDPRQFPHADRFDMTRDPNAHLAFGHGMHFCLGAPLSRLEARIALTDLLARLKRLELASDEPWKPRKALVVHGPDRLPIRFKPG